MDDSESDIEPREPSPGLKATSSRRPLSVTILLIGVLIITVINLVRFVLSIRNWGFLSTRLEISPLYLSLTGLIWAVAGATLLWGLWRVKIWAPRLMQAIALTYALYYWLDLIFLKDHPADGMSGGVRAILPINWPFSAGVTVASLVYVAWTLGRTKVKTYFDTSKRDIDQSSMNSDGQRE